ncbi:MAG TPA: M1 family metallopeptidase [Vicinamibacterales bacterium]
MDVLVIRLRTVGRLAAFGGIVAMLTSAPAAQPAPGAIVRPLSPRNANYTITARLEPATRTITGNERIVWRNITSTTATELQFHLYWNAWKNMKSTFMRERVLSGFRNDENRPANDWSNIDVTAVRLMAPSSADLTASQHFITPDDDNTDDQTVMAIPLPMPVGPGGEVTVELTWTAHVPRTFARTGAIGNFFFIAQWFPKLGVLQQDGWNTHQFHAGTEFFSDYGSYDVSLSVPQRWIVGATGLQRERRDNADGTTTHRYYQDDVHDFTWTTSPDFVERTARFEHPTLPAVDMRLLLQPEHVSQADRHFNATRTTLKYYGEWFGAYPYGHITIVDPAFQSGAGGMEYPTLFTAGTRWLAPAHVTTPEGVTVHEAGHQFWYGIVGNNEFEDAWMDEGFNTFSTARAVAQDYDPNYLALRYFGGFVPWVFKDIPLPRETEGNGLAGYRRTAKSDVQATPTFRYFPSTGGNITYNKTGLWLNTLERWLGWPTLQRIMSTHFDRWKFRHPKPSDFFAIANETSGRDLAWFFDRVYRSADVFDYGVDELNTEPVQSGFRSTVITRRYGEATFPVDVRVTFDDGEQVTEHWDGADRWKLYSYVRPASVVSAEVDPDHVLLLDVNYTNNSKTLEPSTAKAATKWSLKWMVWLQDCLLSWAALV